MTKRKKALVILIGVVVLSTVIALRGSAEVPQQITYQGRLTDQYGDPVPDGDYLLSFALYDVSTGGKALWAEAHTVTVTDGIYNVILGQPGNELNPTDFDGDLYLGVTVGTDAEMTPRQPLTSVGYALRAGVAEGVAEGGVTEIMIYDGAVTNLKVADSAITEEKIEDGATLAEIKDNDGADSGLDADLFDGQDSSAFASGAYVSSLESRIADLETQVGQLVALLQNVTRVANDITFSGVNVHIVNGSGTTDGTTNSLGNLIVGYNELRGTGDDRTGSHNIVVGKEHNYSSYGGLLVGSWNTISNAYASVTGGRYNEASGGYASVSGGYGNTASGSAASVSGGFYNTASAPSASVSGGHNNEASGGYASVTGGRYNIASGNWSFVGGGGDDDADYGNEAYAHYSAILGGFGNVTGDMPSGDQTIGEHSCVSGGYANTASDFSSSVSGGRDNTASGWCASVSGGDSNTASGSAASVSGGDSNTASAAYTSISGGYENMASGNHASVSGGRYNTAHGNYSFVGGGGGDDADDGNIAYAHYSAILGGFGNVTGDMPSTDPSIGTQSTVSGGGNNTASGNHASVSGGGGNTASALNASVSGGAGNTASARGASVSGGANNEATSGWYSAVSGGYNRSVSGDYDWRAGGYFQEQ